MTTYQGMHGNYTIIEPRLAQGGEGEIFKIRGQKDLVLKRFFVSHRTTTRLNKLQAMINAGVPRQLLPQLTWPVDIVFEGGRFIGYVMPALDQSENLNVLYSDCHKLPLNDRVALARNLCVPVDALHQLGQYVGDGNPQNICADPKTLMVTLVDTDSYSITDHSSGMIYPCTVGLASYLPAEVQTAMKQHQGLNRVPKNTFNEYTDRFWLAVHIFQLLMNGTHPFAVRDTSNPATAASTPSAAQKVSSVTLPMPNENICKGFFPHTMKKPGQGIPIACPKFEYLPRTTQNLFIRAFVSGHTDPSARPSAREWFMELGSLQQSLVSGTLCRNPRHQYPSGASFCPWCELASRTIPKPAPVHPVNQNGGYGSGTGGTGAFQTGGGNGVGGKALGCLGMLLSLLISFALLLALPVACTANMMDIHRSEQAAKQQSTQQKIEELRDKMESNQNSSNTSSPQNSQNSSNGPADYNSGMQADGTWEHPYKGRMLQGRQAICQGFHRTVSDTVPSFELELVPQYNGSYFLQTASSDLDLRIIVYDDAGTRIASYISDRPGIGVSMELEAYRIYTAVVEARYHDTGSFTLQFWNQKPMSDMTNYESVCDSIQFTDQINAYEFRCSASADYTFEFTGIDDNLILCMHIYDTYGNRLNSGINLGLNGSISAGLQAGQTYYINVNSYTGEGTYSMTWRRSN